MWAMQIECLPKKKLGGLADMRGQNPRLPPKSGLFDISA